MSKIDPTGGPAFPIPVVQPFGDGVMAVCSMTMLDYFAAQTLGAVARDIHRAGANACGETKESTLNECCELVAELAYSQARAMLSEKRRIESQEDADE